MVEKTDKFSATGRRKTSVARVHLVSGAGMWKVNRREFDGYFASEALRNFIQVPVAAFLVRPVRFVMRLPGRFRWRTVLCVKSSRTADALRVMLV